ncbi:MAG: flavodoxin reductase, partial [Microbacterium sp.]
MSSLTALWNRTFAVLGRVSMYRLVVFALVALAVIAFVLSFFGVLAPSPLELVAAWAALAASCVATDAVAHRLLGKAWRWESSLITVLILLFVLRPTLEPLGLVGLFVAGVIASASKYLLAWQGRHIFNPAAVGATFLTVVSIWLPDLGSSSWWVGTPYLAGPVILLGLVVLLRTEKVRIITLFLVVAVAVAFVRASIQFSQAGLEFDPGTVFWQLLWSSPFLFLGAFMLSEPLTLPPRRWQ